MPNIVDDIYVNITNDIEKIQTKPTVYISHVGQEGTEHLAKEITNNVIDEHNNPRSVSDGYGSIFYDCENTMITVEDHGRGIPFDQLESACTIIHSGTKMERANGESAGENGIGLTVTNALSEIFEITSTRDGQSMMIKFRDGKKIDEKIIKIANKQKHGLTVSFKPSAYLLGENVTLPIESFEEWLHKLSYFMSPSIKLKFTVSRLPGKADSIVKTYQNTEGIGGFLPYMSPDADYMAKPVTIENAINIIEPGVFRWYDDGDVRKRETVDLERHVKIELSFNYTTVDDQPRIYAFCNDIENIEGGYHQDAVLSAVTSVILKSATELQKKTDKFEVTGKDVLTGLRLVLNLRTDYTTGFEQQTKKRLGNKALFPIVRKLVVDELTEFFKLQENKRVVNRIVEIIRENAKIRTDNTEKRSKIRTDTPTVLSSKLISGYTPANLVGKNVNGEELEIYIVEGKSAGGNVRCARFNNDIQGVLATRGKPSNVYGISSKKLAADNRRKPKSKKSKDSEEDEVNERIAFFVVLMDEILGCGYGDHFDINKLIYKKIVLGPDADVDGNHILGLFVADMFKHCPQLILGGYVYRVIAPLYRLDKKGKKSKGIDPSCYVYSKTDLFKRFADTVMQNTNIFAEKNANNIKIRFDGDANCVSTTNIRRFLFTNREYYTTLMEITETYRVHSDVIEYIVMNYDTYRDTGVMEQLDPELHYDSEKGSVYGGYQGKFVSLVFERELNEKLNYLIRLFLEGNDGVGYYHYYKKDSNGEMKHVGYMSIGQIMNSVQMYQVKIDGRYKGFGEMTPAEMYDLVMNPDHRVLLRFTIYDMDKTMLTFDHLFLKKFSSIRKEMVRNANVSIDDIDN